MKGEECRNGKSWTKTIYVLHLDGDTQNSFIVYCREKNWGFLRNYNQMVTLRKKKSFNRTFCSHLNMNVPNNNGIRSRLTCFYDSIIFWDIFLFSLCHQNSTKSLSETPGLCLQGQLKAEEPPQRATPFTSVPRTSNHTFGSRLATPLGTELVRLDRLLLWPGGHRKHKQDPEFVPC